MKGRRKVRGEMIEKREGKREVRLMMENGERKVKRRGSIFKREKRNTQCFYHLRFGQVLFGDFLLQRLIVFESTGLET